MRKIVMMTSVHPHDDVRIFHKEASALAAAGYRVTILNAHWTGERGGVEFRRIQTPTGRAGRMAVWKRYARAALELGGICCLHDPELMPAGLWLRRKGAAVVYDAHEDLPLQVRDKPWIPGPLRVPAAGTARALERYAARRLSGVLTATGRIAARFAKGCPHTAAVRNLPSLAEFPEPVWGNRERAACYVGAITRIRGAAEMIAAARAAGVPLYLAGRFDSEEEQRALLDGAGEEVRYLGVLGRAEVAALLGRCRVGVVALHPTPAYREAIPIKLLEYLAAGLAVVASDFPEWRGLLGEEGCIAAARYVNPMDSGALARVVRELADDPAQSEAMGRAGRRLVEDRLCWEIEKQGLLRFFECLQRAD